RTPPPNSQLSHTNPLSILSNSSFTSPTADLLVISFSSSPSLRSPNLLLFQAVQLHSSSPPPLLQSKLRPLRPASPRLHLTGSPPFHPLTQLPHRRLRSTSLCR
ncbi:hypothetical protein LINPERHAP1_LOCUS5230, partial [Linum perenne]